MSNNKRKFERYHDPDYSGFASVSNHLAGGTTERTQKIMKIIDREFSKNITNKTQEIFQIEERLAESKKLLAKVRYAVVASFYGKQAQTSEKKVTETQTNPSPAASSTAQPIQQQIHPSLKKLIGKTPINYDEILSIRPPREAAKTAASTIKEKLLSKKEEMKIKRMKGMLSAQVVAAAGEKKPRYIEPMQLHKPLPQMNTVRGRNQQKHLIAVGNTSKYIGDEKSADKFTHKWLIYISTKTQIPIEEIVSKVRFFLHPSYQPNDVCEVSCPPFTISRRGWGEFPVRIQLFFHPKIQQKPLQIIHNLVLDKKQTGLQTMGAETVVELWLNNSISCPSVPDSLQQNKLDCDSGKYRISHTNSSSYEIGVKNGGDVDHLNAGPSAMKHPKLEQSVLNIKREPDLSISDMPYVEAITPTTTPQLKLETTQRLIPIPAPVMAHHPPVVPPKPGKFIKCYDKNGKMSFVEVCYDPQNPKKILLKPNSSVIPIPIIGNNNGHPPMIGQSPKLFVKTIGNTAQKIFVASHNQLPPSVQPSGPQLLKPSVYLNELHNGASHLRASLNQSIPHAFKVKSKAKNQVSLLKKGVSLLKPITKSNNQSSLEPPIVTKLASADHDYYSNQNCLINGAMNPVETEVAKTIQIDRAVPKRDFKNELDKQFCSIHFVNPREAVDFLLRRIPLASHLAERYENFRLSFPFVVKSEGEFASLAIPKQRSYEWSRAKLVSRSVRKHPSLQSCQHWTTKEILIYARKFAFTPPITSESANSSTAENKNYLKEIVKREIKREKIKYCSLSLNQAVHAWLTQIVTNRAANESLDSCDMVINVVDVDLGDTKTCKNNEDETQQNSCLLMPLDMNVTAEARFVAEACSKIGIKLEPEEILPGVFHHSTQLVLVQTAKAFIEDMLRRANEKMRNDNVVESDLVDASVKIDDLKHVLLDRFDFLTNSHMGLIH